MTGITLVWIGPAHTVLIRLLSFPTSKAPHFVTATTMNFDAREFRREEVPFSAMVIGFPGHLL